MTEDDRKSMERFARQLIAEIEAKLVNGDLRGLAMIMIDEDYNPSTRMLFGRDAQYEMVAGAAFQQQIITDRVMKGTRQERKPAAPEPPATPPPPKGRTLN